MTARRVQAAEAPSDDEPSAGIFYVHGRLVLGRQPAHWPLRSVRRVLKEAHGPAAWPAAPLGGSWVHAATSPFFAPVAGNIGNTYINEIDIQIVLSYYVQQSEYIRAA